SVIALPNPWAPPVTTALQPLRSMLLLAIRALLFVSLWALHRQTPRQGRRAAGSTATAFPSKWQGRAASAPGVSRQQRPIQLLGAPGGGLVRGRLGCRARAAGTGVRGQRPRRG